MAARILHEDALSATPTGCGVRIALPWIRSLPLHCVVGLSLAIDDSADPAVEVSLGNRRCTPAALSSEPGWWYLQDRLLVLSRRTLSPGVHTVSVSLDLMVPHLASGPTGPLLLPMQEATDLVLDAPPQRGSAHRDVEGSVSAR